MIVPEAAVNEYDHRVFWQHYVRLSRQIFAMQPVAKALGEETPPYFSFKLAILATNRRHHPASSLFVNEVSQLAGPTILVL